METKIKKRIILLALVAIGVLVAGTYAAFTAKTSTTEDVSTAALAIELVQSTAQDGVTAIAGDAKKGAGYQYIGVPGDTVNEVVAVKNTAGRDAYVRVTINRAWTDESGKKIFGQGITPESIDIINTNGDWLVIKDANDPEVIQCYLKAPLRAGATSASVMESFTILKDKLTENSNGYTGLASNITFKADAIQTTAAQDAMVAEWGVVATFDGTTLTAVTEQ